MFTKGTSWMRRLSSLLGMLVLMTSFTGHASASILFQDDSVGDFESEILNVGSNDAGANDTAIRFGADGTASENGNINWNITTNTFELDHTTAITGGVSATGNANFAGASEFHIREVADEATAACTTVSEIVLDTTENKIYTCTVTGTPGTWTSTSPSSSDFEAVYAADADKTLTTSNGAFTINVGSNTFAVTGTTNINASNNAATNIGTGTTTSTVSIGGGSNSVAINSSSWDISSAGVASGLTGITSTGTVNFSGAAAFRIRENADPATNSACATVGELILDTTDNQVQVCTVTGIAGAATWVNTANGGDATTLDGIDSTQFLRNDASNTITTGTTTFNSGTTLTVNGVANIGDGGDAIAVNSSTWDISSAGAASGFTTIDASGNITTSAGTFCVGTTCLNETTSATDSGAFIVGAFDEFTNSNSTTVQGVLNDLDALVGSNAPNVENLTFYAQYPDSVLFADGSNNSGRMDALYDDTNDKHYYEWTSNQGTTNDYDVRFSFVLPPDFVTVGNFTYEYRTGTTTTADNNAEIRVYNATDGMTLCDSDTTNGTAAAWATGTLSALATGCTAGNALNAGDIVEVDIKLSDKSGVGTYADVGKLSLAYSN